MTAPLRAAHYLRVSTVRQAEHDVSIPDQRRQGEAWCARRHNRGPQQDPRPLNERFVPWFPDGREAAHVQPSHGGLLASWRPV